MAGSVIIKLFKSLKAFLTYNNDDILNMFGWSGVLKNVGKVIKLAEAYPADSGSSTCSGWASPAI